MAKQQTKSDRQAFWGKQIAASEKLHENWRKTGLKTIEKYRDEKKHSSSQFNILWANTEILKSATLSRVSKPNIARRFKNDDPVARDASILLEKCCDFVHDETEFADELKLARDDFLLPGRGVIRLKYHANLVQTSLERAEIGVDDLDDDLDKAEIFMLDGEIKEPEGFFDPEDRDSAYVEQVASEEIIPEYVHWKDFLCSQSRHWNEVWWVAFRHGMVKDEIENMFGEERVKEIEIPSATRQDTDGNKTDVFEVWEIWDKRNRKRIWYVGEAKDTIEIEDAPLDLKNFFPCPKPLVPFTTTDTTVPVSLYSVYRDQAQELNVVAGRLEHLTAMVKAAGLYDSANAADMLSLRNLGDGEFKALSTAADFGGSGGFKNAIFHLPISEYAAVIQILDARATKLKEEIFELTGIADIMRGHTDPYEGVGTQRIKTVFGTLRLRPLREPVEDFIREAYEIVAEIAADKFEPQTWAAYTGEAPSPEVLKLLKDDGLRGYRINVETDSTVIPNEEIDRAKSEMFLTATSSFLSAMLPVIQAAPEMAVIAGEMLKFGVRSFKAGRELEEVITDELDKLVKMAQQPNPQAEEQPDPKIQVAQIQAQTTMGKAQMDAQTKQASDQMKAQVEMIKLEVQKQMAEAQNATTIRKNELDAVASGRRAN